MVGRSAAGRAMSTAAAVGVSRRWRRRARRRRARPYSRGSGRASESGPSALPPCARRSGRCRGRNRRRRGRGRKGGRTARRAGRGGAAGPPRPNGRAGRHSLGRGKGGHVTNLIRRELGGADLRYSPATLSLTKATPSFLLEATQAIIVLTTADVYSMLPTML